MDIPGALHRGIYGKEGSRKKSRVGNITAGFMVGLALLFDLTQFVFSFFHAVPVVGGGIAVVVAWYIAVLSFIIFGLWFGLCGVNYFTGKRAGLKLLAAFGTFVVEIVPLIDAVPAITAGVITMIIASRIEDFVGQEKDLEKLSERGKLAAAGSLIAGRRVREQDARAGDLSRLQSGVRRVSQFSRSANLEDRTARNYGKRSEGATAAYNEAADKKSAVLSLVRGKDLRGERREQNTQGTGRGAA